MKIKIKNIIKNLAQSIVFKRFVLVLFILHLVLVHIMLQNYILCFENDGSIVLKSIEDKINCCDPSFAMTNAEYSESNKDENCSFCEDVSITDNCYDEYTITVKKAELTSVVILQDSVIPYTFNKKKFSFINKFRNSPQLDSYKTVSLLI